METYIYRKAAKALEDEFLKRIEINISRTSAVYCPLDGKTYDFGKENRNRRQYDQTDDVKRLVREHVKKNLFDAYEEMPKNTTIINEITHKGFLGKRITKISIAVGAVSPIEDLALFGCSTTPSDASKIMSIKRVIVTDPSVFYYICVFSTIGWEEEISDDILSGANYLIALSEIQEGRWCTFFTPDNRWAEASLIFDLSLED